MSGSPSAPAGRVLVVDDDLMMRELLTTRLVLAGFETLQARNGREALQVIAQLRPTAMVLDINMPELDGFGVLEHLNRAGLIDDLRVIVLTARNQAADVRRALDLGARDFLTKPFSDAQFLTRIARLLRGVPRGPSSAGARLV
jgi:DNA-binding response OmpR family regulator